MQEDMLDIVQGKSFPSLLYIFFIIANYTLCLQVPKFVTQISFTSSHL